MRILAGSMLVSALVLSFIPAQAAPGDVLVVARDARADVRITNSAGPNAAVRRTIDLRRVRVVERQARVRFEVKIKRVLGQRDFDQMFFVRLRPPAGSAATWTGDLGFSAQTRDLGYASYFDGATYESCDPLRTKRLSSRVVALDVPKRCLPQGEARMVVRSYTGIFRSDAPVWSRDRLRVPGLVSVQ